jgi:penicillin-insensitive murein endopeptidase
LTSRTLRLLVALLAVGSMPCFAQESTQSLSLQNASNGRLVNGEQLPASGPHHRVRQKTLVQHANWGTNELVQAVHRAAKAVAVQAPGALLLVGNMSYQRGGDLRGSVSHNSGRDVDFGFYAVDRKGRVRPQVRLISFDRHGRAGSLVFDDEQNWSLVKALLTDPSIQVQWMFVSEALEKRLLSFAHRSLEPSALVNRAEHVLNRPGNSSIHRDHFHVRLYCARHERLKGCLNYGPIWPWIDDHQKAVDDHAQMLSARVTNTNTNTALQAMEIIEAIRGKRATVALINALRDTRQPIRTTALGTLRALGALDSETPQLIDVWRQTPPGPWRNRILETLVEVGDQGVSSVLHAILEDTATTPTATRVVACRGLARLTFGPAVPALATQLIHPDQRVRKAAFFALESITNHRLGRGKRALRRWKRWWQTHGSKSRMAWVTRGFRRRHGIRANPPLTNETLDTLVTLIGRGGPAARNARWLIGQHKNFFVERAHFSDTDLERFYRKWLRRKRRRAP